MGKVGTEETLATRMSEATGLALLEKMCNAVTYLDILANGETLKSWAGYKRLVQDGIAERNYPVGSQLIDKWAKDANTEFDAPWDIVHYDAEGNAFVKWHFATPDGLPFDAPEAIYYAGADGLAAGTYHIPIGSAYGQGWKVGDAIQFTLTAAMDAGDQLYINFGTNYDNDPTAGRAWNVYAKGSTTSKQNGTTSKGTEGTSLGTIGATSAQKPEGQLNAIALAVYGSGRWSQSAMRQWLNSEAAAGAWWTPQNDWDRPPAEAATLRGFLAGCTADFLSILEPVEVVTALNTVEGYDTDRETTIDRIFLPSLEQMYINPQLSGAEGEYWDYYKELAEEAGLPGKFQRYQTYPILITYSVDAHSSAVHIRVRSAIRGGANNTWLVYASGTVNNAYYAYYAHRGCPACKIRKSQ